MNSQLGQSVSGNNVGHTIIGSTLVVDGTLKSSENITINGKLTGAIETSENVVIGNGATVDANIQCQSITVAGVVNGDIHAQGGVTLQSSANVQGDITSTSIAVEPGATINGSINTSVSGADSTTATDSTES